MRIELLMRLAEMLQLKSSLKVVRPRTSSELPLHNSEAPAVSVPTCKAVQFITSATVSSKLCDGLTKPPASTCHTCLAASRTCSVTRP